MRTKLTPTWIVIADSAQADIYKYQGPNNKLAKVKNGHLEHINQKSQDLVSDDRGRVFSRGGVGRSAMSRTTDPHQHEKHKFALEIKRFLQKNNSRFDRLIISSPPKLLGDLRKSIPNNIKSKITAEIDKDLTKVPANDLPDYLEDFININSQHRSLSNAYVDAKP